METMNIPVISTAHLPGPEAVKGVLCAEYEFGWFLYLDPDHGWGLEWYDDLVEHFRPAGYEWVRLDCDADPVPELKTYDW